MKQAEPVDASRPVQGPCFASLVGRFQLRAPNGSEIVIANRRARALLAMLCLAGGEALERDFLSRLLWPGRFEAHAKASLRQCLLDLGKLLAPCGMDILDATRASVTLRPGALMTDLGALEAALACGDHAAATAKLAAIGTTPILDQMDFGDAFNQWLDRHRGDAEKRLRGAVEEALAALALAGDEAPHARLMLASSLRIAAVAAHPVAITRQGGARLAVLPFQSDGGRDGPDYFADGMVDELITALGQVPQLTVSGRTSSFHFRDSDLPPARIAGELGVAHLVEGSVHRQGDRVRIHAHLIAGETGDELWGARFDGTLDDVFAFQEQVAQAITAAIGTALGIAMQAPRVRGTTHSKAAYDLYLQGRALCSRIFGNGVLDKAIALLEQALELDPDFAECWVMLAEAHQLVAVYTQCFDRQAASARMADCARRAIALSPALGYPHALLGIHEWAQRNIVGALDLAYKAYRLEPENPAVTMRLGSFLIYCGRTGDAERYVRAAIDQDPVDPRKYALVWAVHMARGELEPALKAGQKIVDLGFPSIYLAVTTAIAGDHALAVEQYQHTKHLINTIILPPTGASPMTAEAMDAYWLIGAKGICSGQESDRMIYGQVLEMMYATLPDKGDLAITSPAVLTGNAELLFKSLGEHVSPANMLAFVSLWADFEPFRRVWQHPGFIPFAQRIGMVAAWDKYGWPDLLPPPGEPRS